MDLDGPLPVSAPFVEVNGRVGTMSKGARILRRTEDADDNHCKRSVKYPGGVDPLEGRRTNGWSFAQYQLNLGADEPGR